MSRELLHLLDLIEQGIEVNEAQIKHCHNMDTIIKENVELGMPPEHALSAGAILGWGLGTSSAYIKGNIDKLIPVLRKIDVDVTALENSNNIPEKAPGENLDQFVEDYVEKARLQMESLKEIKTYLLSEEFDSGKVDDLYSPGGRALLEEDFEKGLRRLLED